MRNYILEGKVPKPVDDILEWAKWFGSADRTVKKDVIGDVNISTVFIGIDHSFGGREPELFETMMNKSPDEAEKVAEFYDYIEVHPKPVYSQLVDGGIIHSEWNLEDIL